MQLDNIIHYKDAADMKDLHDETVDLIVTSPPYPMVEMWDGIFSKTSAAAGAALTEQDGNNAFNLMHEVLDSVWSECFRTLKPGGFACINIGDATRKIGDDFRLYPNHSRITRAMLNLGLNCMPIIHWFKPTNAPNKFMGSGMLPSGAYVTLEHEYILIFRKGVKRSFSPDEQRVRRRSAFFWEERNRWFSDVWNFKGESQLLEQGRHERNRSGAFPFELPYRLINMYSMQGDTVLDPFIGTGTTLAAAIINARRCIGYETDGSLAGIIRQKAETAARTTESFIKQRLRQHDDFIEEYTGNRGKPGYLNGNYNSPVVTRQEREIRLPVSCALGVESYTAADYFNADYLSG